MASEAGLLFWDVQHSRDGRYQVIGDDGTIAQRTLKRGTALLTAARMNAAHRAALRQAAGELETAMHRGGDAWAVRLIARWREGGRDER